LTKSPGASNNADNLDLIKIPPNFQKRNRAGAGLARFDSGCLGPSFLNVYCFVDKKGEYNVSDRLIRLKHNSKRFNCDIAATLKFMRKVLKYKYIIKAKYSVEVNERLVRTIIKQLIRLDIDSRLLYERCKGLSDFYDLF